MYLYILAPHAYTNRVLHATPAQSVRGYSNHPSLPKASEAVQSVRGLSMRLSLLRAHCVLGPDLYSLQVSWRLLCIYMRRLVYAIRVLHATPGKEGAICIYIYVYICIYVYAAPAATQSVRCYSKRTRVTKRPRLFKASDACQCAWACSTCKHVSMYADAGKRVHMYGCKQIC